MPDKIRRNLEYAAAASLRADVSVILATLRNLVRTPLSTVPEPLTHRRPTA
jgi:hypothetical protein